jgi:hypothetical protein
VIEQTVFDFPQPESTGERPQLIDVQQLRPYVAPRLQPAPPDLFKIMAECFGCKIIYVDADGTEEAIEL